MTGNEIRAIFLNYFAKNGHKIVSSSPLLPANDPTLMFANAGMNQFKDVFIGAEKRDYKRATTSQKCVRAGGKHNDLDEVGKTARHHTFFEMLGNFSFGDYFKEDAIKFAWELLVGELKLDPKRLWFSVFEGDAEVGADEEAIALWQKVGAPAERILRFGRKDNFWQMGETGPCGPCSEIHYYRGENPDDPNFNKAEYVNGAGDDTMEIWNLVFMQYNRSEIEPGKYKLDPLPAPSVDTGMGLERVAAVLQGVYSNYDTDLIKPIIDFTAQLAGKEYKYETQEGFAMRVIADHARATAFSIADGILPGNEGRNYVLRKIMRRAIYNGRENLKFNGLFFSKVCEFVIDFMKGAYPELDAQRSYIEKMVRLEEERFGTTLTVGLRKFSEIFSTEENKKLIDDLVLLLHQTNGEETIGQKDEFNNLMRLLVPLNDTYGVPRDLIRVGLEKLGLSLPEEKFLNAFDVFIHAIHGSDLRGAGTQARVKDAKWSNVEEEAKFDKEQAFLGYKSTRVEDVKILYIFPDIPGAFEESHTIQPNKSYEIVLDKTPFYAESGGQVGDTGEIYFGKYRFVVTDTIGTTGGLIIHKAIAKFDSIVSREELIKFSFVAQVDVEKRDATRRNHTATHLMHAALREVLGTHVKQAGSIVAPDYLRFDFAHYQPLTESEIVEIEALVNFHILRNESVQTDVLAIEDAMRSGAMALFGEKYGEKVRVLTVNGAEGIFSKELCGGTHVRATGDIGSFKILSDEAIASGTRRIRAVTGRGAFERFQSSENLLAETAARLNTPAKELPATVDKLQEQIRQQQKEIERLKLKLAQGGGGSEDQITEINGIKLLVRKVDELGKEGRRQLADSLTRKIAPGVVVIADVVEGKASLLVMVSDDATSRVQAGKIIREIPGARGGGKPDLAEGGVELDKLDEALKTIPSILEKALS